MDCPRSADMPCKYHQGQGSNAWWLVQHPRAELFGFPSPLSRTSTGSTVGFPSPLSRTSTGSTACMLLFDRSCWNNLAPLPWYRTLPLSLMSGLLYPNTCFRRWCTKLHRFFYDNTHSLFPGASFCKLCRCTIPDFPHLFLVQRGHCQVYPQGCPSRLPRPWLNSLRRILSFSGAPSVWINS